jgi:hypothetical protein
VLPTQLRGNMPGAIGPAAILEQVDANSQAARLADPTGSSRSNGNQG